MKKREKLSLMVAVFLFGLSWLIFGQFMRYDKPASPQNELSQPASILSEEQMPEYIEGKKAYDNDEYQRAETWFLKAVEKGNTAAMFELGNMHYQDGEKAIYWWTKAAENGNVEAMAQLGWLYFMKIPDFDKSLAWYSKAAETGDIDAMLNLGLLYSTDIPPLRHGRDYEKARQWYEKAAERGNAAAMYQLKWLYDQGYGVKKEHEGTKGGKHEGAKSAKGTKGQ